MKMEELLKNDMRTLSSYKTNIEDPICYLCLEDTGSRKERGKVSWFHLLGCEKCYQKYKGGNNGKD